MPFSNGVIAGIVFVLTAIVTALATYGIIYNIGDDCTEGKDFCGTTAPWNSTNSKCEGDVKDCDDDCTEGKDFCGTNAEWSSTNSECEGDCDNCDACPVCPVGSTFCYSDTKWEDSKCKSDVVCDSDTCLSIPLAGQHIGRSLFRYIDIFSCPLTGTLRIENLSIIVSNQVNYKFIVVINSIHVKQWDSTRLPNGDIPTEHNNVSFEYPVTKKDKIYLLTFVDGPTATFIITGGKLTICPD